MLQVLMPIAEWMGVDGAHHRDVFPNIQLLCSEFVLADAGNHTPLGHDIAQLQAFGSFGWVERNLTALARGPCQASCWKSQLLAIWNQRLQASHPPRVPPRYLIKGGLNSTGSQVFVCGELTSGCSSTPPFTFQCFRRVPGSKSLAVYGTLLKFCWNPARPIHCIRM